MSASLPISSVAASDRSRPVAFALVFLVLIALHQAAGIEAYIFDSYIYWTYSAPSVLLSFTPSIRGYLYLTLLMPLNALCDGLLGGNKEPFRIVVSLIYAWALTGPASDFFARVFASKPPSTARRTVFALLPVALFPGLFLYPLSDLPAVLMMTAASFLAWRIRGRFWWLFAVLAGVAMGAAYNTRTVYLFGCLGLLLVCPAILMRDQPSVRRWLAPILLLLGALLISIPQMVWNQHVHGRASPFVIADVRGKSLMPSQLYWGITVQRYETSIRQGEIPSRFYLDPAGLAFRDKMGGDLGEPSIAAYIRLVVRDPLVFAGIYARHFVNGVDVRDGTVYTKAISSRRNSASLLCFTLLFFAGLVAASRGGIRWREVASLAPLLVPVLAVVPGAVETRFFLPIYLIAFSIIAFEFNRSALVNYAKRNAAALSLLYFLMGSIFMAITNASLAILQYGLP